MSLDKFMVVYEEGLRYALANYPQEYAYSLDMVPTVLERMREAMQNGSYHHVGRAFRYTTKKLGIPHTRKAIEEFLGLRKVAS